MKRLLTLFIVTLLLMPSIGYSETIIANIGQPGTLTENLAGTKVYIDFEDSTQSGWFEWQYNNSTNFSGINEGGDWSFELLGPTTNSWEAWVLTAGTTTINSITIDLFDEPNRLYSFFDIANDAQHTPGSSWSYWEPNDWRRVNGGLPHLTEGNGFTNANGFTFDWAFTDSVRLINEPSYNDLFTTLYLNFEPYAHDHGVINIDSDDHSGLKNDVFVFTAGTFTGVAIPEPATLLLFGFGLLGLSSVSRRRKE